MDNAPIHQGDNFDQVCQIMKESNKETNIKFLHKYSPMLNPIELVFNIIKIPIKHQGSQSLMELSKSICGAIEDKIIGEVAQKCFIHFQEFYKACGDMQPMTGTII